MIFDLTFYRYLTGMMRWMHSSPCQINLFDRDDHPYHPQYWWPFTNVLYEIHSHEHWLQLEPGEQSRFLSCGGVGNGLCFRAPSKQSRLHFDDWEFQTCCAVRLRHFIQAPPKCCNKSLAGLACFQDNTLFHPLSCKVGGGVSFLHTAICTQLTKIVKDAGLRAHREVPIPEFAHIDTQVRHCVR